MIQQSALILTIGLVFLFFFTPGYENVHVLSQPISILLLLVFTVAPAILSYLFGRLSIWRIMQRISNDILLSRILPLYSLISSIFAIGGFIAQVYYLQTPVMISNWLAFFSFVSIRTFLCIIPLIIAMVLNRIVLLKLHRLIQDDLVTLKNFVLPDFKLMFLPSIPFLISLIISDLIDHSPISVRIFFIVHQYLYWIIILAIAVIMFIKSPFFIRHIWETKPLKKGEILNRIESFSKRVKLKYKDAMVWNMGGRDIANAGVTGLLPGSRSVFLTDSLLHNLNADEIEAIVAHEFGHIKYMHIPAYMVFTFGYLVFFSFIYALALPFTDKISISGVLSALVGAIFAIIIFLVYFIFIFRYLSRRFEKQADFYAISTISNPEVFKRALFKVASINHLPMQSSRFGSIFRTHPSIYERLQFADGAMAGDPEVLKYGRLFFDFRKVTVILLIAMIALWITDRNALFPPDEMHYELGRQYAMEGMFDDAIAEFRKAINNDPKNDNSFYALGLVYIEKDEIKNAEIEFQKALEINPKNTSAINKLKQIQH
ncbi:MAG: Tetratricopeptide repeat protein [Candidatus Poribacteria bacterium]|nr:Tetratricopeptide repeat protein [Candidatus Poribacteria bacterium]